MRRGGFRTPRTIFALDLSTIAAACPNVPACLEGGGMARRNGFLTGLATAILGAAALAACSPAKKAETASSAPAAAAATPIRFATDWHAQAEHGGFYEALAEGEYSKRG